MAPESSRTQDGLSFHVAPENHGTGPAVWRSDSRWPTTVALGYMLWLLLTQQTTKTQTVRKSGKENNNDLIITTKI